MPSCRARASTARTSAANARVGKARASESGQAARLRLEAALQGLPDPELLLGTGEQPDRRRQPVGLRADAVGEPAEQRVAERVEGHGERRDRGAAQPGGDPGPQVGGRAAGEGEHQDPVRRHAAALDPLHHRLDQRGGLARARTGQHQQRAARMVDDGLLVGIEDRGGGRRLQRADQAVHRVSSSCVVVGCASPSLDQTLPTVRPRSRQEPTAVASASGHPPGAETYPWIGFGHSAQGATYVGWRKPIHG